MTTGTGSPALSFTKDPRFFALADLYDTDPGSVVESLIAAALTTPQRATALARLWAAVRGRAVPPPYDDPTLLGAMEDAATPRQRSVVFVGNAYYHFFYLAQALRRRGWDAIAVNILDDVKSGTWFHGCDLDLHSADPAAVQASVRRFLGEVVQRFRMVHFYGKGCLALVPENTGVMVVPWDTIALKHRGVKIGYTTYGCQDCVAQSSFDRWSDRRCCKACVWASHPEHCSDAVNLAWGRRVRSLADLVCIETDAALDHKLGAEVYPEPLTCALDPALWRPGLPIPERLRRPRAEDEVVIHHAVGNYDLRTRQGRNVKGTHALRSAVESLQGKGLNVRLDLVHGVPSHDMRFIQAQADIVVEQLLYGRHGATARESMMLGKPTIFHVNRSEEAPNLESPYLAGCPGVPANVDTIETVLEELVRDPARRDAIGRASRVWALRWWSADACAERYEAVYDRIVNGRPVQHH